MFNSTSIFLQISQSSNKKQKHYFFLGQFNIYISTFRTLAIWPDSRLLGLALFTISIYQYLKFQEKRKFFSCIKNIIFLSLSAYVSPNFSLFAVFYFLNFLIFYKKNFKKIILIILLNVILSLPAFFYIFYLEYNFLSNAAVLNRIQNQFSPKYSKQYFFNFFLVFFYLIPFLILNIFKLKLNKNLVLNITTSLVILTYVLIILTINMNIQGVEFF